MDTRGPTGRGRGEVGAVGARGHTSYRHTAQRTGWRPIKRLWFVHSDEEWPQAGVLWSVNAKRFVSGSLLS